MAAADQEPPTSEPPIPPEPTVHPEPPIPSEPTAHPGPGGRRPTASRCFVAVRPPPGLIDRLRSMDRPHRQGLRWTGEEQWHVTLKFFAAVDQEALVGAIDRWSRSPGGPSPARATSGPRPRPLGGRVWIVPVEGLDDLAGGLDTATADLEDPAAPGDRRRPFRGHLTLARAHRPAALRGLPEPDLQVTWPVEEVLAFRSELGRHGARHQVIGRWAVPPDREDRSASPRR